MNALSLSHSFPLGACVSYADLMALPVSIQDYMERVLSETMDLSPEVES